LCRQEHQTFQVFETKQMFFNDNKKVLYNYNQQWFRNNKRYFCYNLLTQNFEMGLLRSCPAISAYLLSWRV